MASMRRTPGDVLPTSAVSSWELAAAAALSGGCGTGFSAMAASIDDGSCSGTKGVEWQDRLIKAMGDGWWWWCGRVIRWIRLRGREGFLLFSDEEKLAGSTRPHLASSPGHPALGNSLIRIHAAGGAARIAAIGRFSGKQARCRSLALVSVRFRYQIVGETIVRA